MTNAPANLQLYITSFGCYLHVKDALFELRRPVEDGGTSKQHFAARKVKSIIFTVGGALSTAAVQLAMEHNIDILFAQRDGHPFSRVWHAKLGSTTLIRKQQLRASVSNIATSYTTQWLHRKLEQQQQLLIKLKKHRAKEALSLLEDRASKIERLAGSIATIKEEGGAIEKIAGTLRGLEGTAGRLYWQTLSTLLPPPYQFAGRSFRPAQDPFNAFLNYAYGMLYGRVEKALMIAGIDPFVGFLHRDDYNQKSMVFDFIEPYRIHADYCVFRLFSGKRVNSGHYQALQQGVGLTKEGKQLVIEHFNAYLDEGKVRHRGRNLCRAHVLQLEAHRLASELVELPFKELEIKEL